MREAGPLGSRGFLPRVSAKGRLMRLLVGIGAVALGFALAVQAGCADNADRPEVAAVTKARQEFLAGRYDRATAAYQDYLQHFAHGRFRREAWQRLVDMRDVVGEPFATTVTLLETAALENAADPAVAAGFFEQAGQVCLRHEDYGQATVFYQKIIDMPGVLPKRRLDAYLQLAHIRILARDEDGALRILRRCTGPTPGPDTAPQCTFALAELYLGRGRTDDARPLFRSLYDATALDPELRARAGLHLAKFYEKQHEIEEAKALYGQLLSLFPNKRVIESRLQSLDK